MRGRPEHVGDGVPKARLGTQGARLDLRAGHALIWPGRAIYFGPLLENEAHAHHAIQISIALEDALSLQVGPGLRWSAYRAVATAPDQLHRIRCRGPIVQIYLDPESAAGLALRERMGDAGVQSIDLDDLASCSAALRTYSKGELDEGHLARVIDDVTSTAAPISSRKLIDPRVQKALGIVHALPERHLSLSVLADEVALSPSRLGTLFRRDTGIPVRRYLLWLRLIDAIEAFSDGTTLTEAAHHAGFSDSAHLSRTFRRMFGMPPSRLRSEHVEIRRLADGSP